MKSATLKIIDQVNCKFEGLEPEVRRKISDACKYFVPYARHMPAFKLGRWDGKIAFATIGGGTFINMLDRVLPIVLDAGYSLDSNLTIDDRRPPFSFSFPEITEDMLSDKVWPEGHQLAGDPIMLRDYQVEAIKRYLDNLQSVQSISTGAGKCLDYNTEILVDIDETTEIGSFLLNKLSVSTGAGNENRTHENNSITKLV